MTLTALVRRGTLALLAAGLLSAGACAYHHYASPLVPAPLDIPGAVLAEDGAVEYSQPGLLLRLRALSDQQLNRQFATHSEAGPASTNPFTFADTRFLRSPHQRQRFTVFHVELRNHEYRKIKLDPVQTRLEAPDGRQYWALTLDQLDSYYRAYLQGHQGNEYLRYQQRLDLARSALYKNEEVFPGDASEGLLVFPVLAPHIGQVTLHLSDLVLRFDPRGEPVESLALTFPFVRDVGRAYEDGRVDLADR